MSTWDFSAAGVNGLLNNTSKSKMKITMIPYEDIMRNEKNHYSIEDIESLAASISDVGLREPLEVKPLDDGQYMLIGGRAAIYSNRPAPIGRQYPSMIWFLAS